MRFRLLFCWRPRCAFHLLFCWHPRCAFRLLFFWHPRCASICFFAGIRNALSLFMRCPCAGRHLLFFSAAKKSRQKKAAHTASACVNPRALNVPALHTAARSLMFVAATLDHRPTRLTLPHHLEPVRALTAHLRQTVCKLSRHRGRGTEFFWQARKASRRESQHTVCRKWACATRTRGPLNMCLKQVTH